jgi:DNA-binding transcriptional LysR family regulator
VEIRDLRYFIAAAETGQFRRAAQQVGRSQPALTKCIHRLEEELGASLFDRKGHRVYLTTVGRALLARAKIISQSLDAAAREAADIADGTKGHLRVGTGSTTAACFLPGLFKRMIPQFPGVTFDVLVGLADHLRQLLHEGELDLVIGPLSDSDRREFSTLVIDRDELVIAASERHRFVGRRVRIEDLANERWLLPSAPLGSTQWLNTEFARRGLKCPHVQVQASSVVLLRQVIANTDLLTFISRRDIDGRTNPRYLREIQVPEVEFRRDLGILYVEGRHLSAAAGRLLELARQDVAVPRRTRRLAAAR